MVGLTARLVACRSSEESIYVDRFSSLCVSCENSLFFDSYMNYGRWGVVKMNQG